MSSAPRQDGREVVERYLAGVVNHDWDEVASCVSADVVRVGPFGDTYSGRERYLAFLSDLMPKLEGYSMRVDRVDVLAHSRSAVAELTETVSLDGTPIETPEALVFDFDDELRIAHIAIYIQRKGG